MPGAFRLIKWQFIKAKKNPNNDSSLSGLLRGIFGVNFTTNS